MPGSCSEHDECMICLSSLLAGEEDDEYDEDFTSGSLPGSSSEPAEIGAVFPCGHVFHLKCWDRWKGERCVICNQQAILFSKIFITAPSLAGEANSPAAIAKATSLSREERSELERYRQKERDEEEDRIVLEEMELRMDDDPEGARRMMSLMLKVQHRDLRKSERELFESQEECEMTHEILRVTQSDLDESASELKDVKPKAERLQEELDRLKRARWEAATQRGEKHKQQIAALQAKVDRYKEKLSLTKAQLARRNKELISKRKLISSHKMELAASGKEQQRICRKTKEDLRVTKKELELLRELDSMTMGESMSSFGNGSLTWT